MTHDAFISHSFKDSELADSICKHLEAKGIRCWLATRDILPGLTYPEALMDAINQGQVFILILSARSNTSHQVFREVERAASKGKTIITVLVEKLEVSKNLEFLISLQNWLDATEPPLEKHLDYLAKAVHILQKGAAPENQDEDEPEPQARQRSAEINTGPFVPKLCDRSSQVHTFVNTFIANLKRYPKRPQVYFIHGEEGECHDSLVERLIHVHLKPIAERIWGRQRAVVTFKKLRWPVEGSPAELQEELKRMLFFDFDPAYIEDDFSINALGKLTAAQLSSLILLRYNIYAEHWNRSTTELLLRYLSYWYELNANYNVPQFLIIFSVIYPSPASAGWWKFWSRSRNFDKEQVQREMAELCSSPDQDCPPVLLQELLPPSPHEIGEWFSQYNIYNTKIQRELLKNIFEAEAAKVNMAHIEHELQKIHHNFIKERGYS